MDERSTWPPSVGGTVTLDATLSEPAFGFMVAGAGDVSVTFAESGETLVLPACQPGVMYPAYVSKFNTTGTTATGLVWLR